MYAHTHTHAETDTSISNSPAYKQQSEMIIHGLCRHTALITARVE